MSYPTQRHTRSTGSIPANANRSNPTITTTANINSANNRGFSHTPNPNAHLSGVNGSPSTTSSTRVSSSKHQAASTGNIPNEGLYPPPGSSGSQSSFNLPSPASPGARNGSPTTAAGASSSGYGYSPQSQQPPQVYTTPTREFLVNVDIWSSAAAIAAAGNSSGKNKIKVGVLSHFCERE
jgi:hypothetical protein